MTNNSDSLSTKQVIIMIILGVVLWFVFAMAFRFLSPMGWFDDGFMVLQFILAFPITWIVLLLSIKIVGLKKGQILKAVAIALAAAVYLDGFHFAFTPSLYGTNSELLVGGAGWILWGGGVALTLGFVEDYRQKQ